jgi:arylsulfatase A-like enzyme
MKILVLETLGLQLGYVGCYGNDWVGTPNLDRLAVEGVAFDWHFADQPELEPTTPWAERSVATGRYGLPGQQSPSPAHALVPRLLRCDSLTALAAQIAPIVEAGCDWLWVEGPSLLPPWRLDAELLEAYFDEDDVAEGLTPWPDPPLGPAALEEAEVVRLQNTYAAAVTVFDAQLGVLLDRLRAAGMLDNMLVCVTARSGLPLGEHGTIGAARPMLHDELVHVPLLLRLPQGAHGGTRIGALTQAVDLAPTLLEALGQPALPDAHGRSLLPLVRGERTPVRPYAVSAQRVAGAEAWLLRTPAWALHLPVGERAPRLFVKPEDRWEVNDLYQQQIEIAEPMAQTLRAFADAIRQPGPLTCPVLAGLVP